MCGTRPATHPVVSPVVASPSYIPSAAAAAAPSVHQPVASAPILENPIVAPGAAEPKNKLVDMLQQLHDMGFSDKQRNIAVLVEHNFNLAQAISALVRTN